MQGQGEGGDARGEPEVVGELMHRSFFPAVSVGFFCWCLLVPSELNWRSWSIEEEEEERVGPHSRGHVVVTFGRQGWAGVTWCGVPSVQ